MLNSKKGFLPLAFAMIPFWGLLVLVGIIILVVFGATWFLTANLAKVVGFILLYVGAKAWEREKKLNKVTMVILGLGLVFIFNPLNIVTKFLPMATIPMR